MSSLIAAPTARPSARRSRPHRRGVRSAFAAAAGFACLGALSVVVAPPASAAPQGRILFTSDAAGSDQIFVMGADGTDVEQLTTGRGASYDAAWSPDGNRVAFASDRGGSREIYTMDPDGGSVVQVTDTGGSSAAPAWSPDGEHIAFDDDRGGSTDIWVVDADGGVATQLTDAPAVDAHPDWSPDGRSIVFTSHRDGNGEAYLMDADGSDERNVTNRRSSELDAVFTPDGDHIAVSTDAVAQPWAREIVLISRATGAWTQVTSGPVRHRAPELSPDGQWLTTTSESAAADIWVMPLNGPNAGNLTNSGAFDRHASWG